MGRPKKVLGTEQITVAERVIAADAGEFASSFTEASKAADKRMVEKVEDEGAALETKDVVGEYTLAQKILGGKWHLIELHSGGRLSQDDPGFVTVPDHLSNKQMTLPKHPGYWVWVPDICVNILRECQRNEAFYEENWDSGKRQMVARANIISCHPFTIHKTRNGKPSGLANYIVKAETVGV